MDTTDEMYQKESTPEKPDKEGDDKNDSMEDSALLPKSFFGSKELKVGSECKVKIEHLWEDEVEVSYVKHDKDKKDKDSDDDDDDDDKPKKRQRHHHHHDDDEDFLSDRKVSMMGIGDIGTPGAGP